jgi:hypothetical protein
MLWLTWRQHRTHALFAVLALAALAAVLVPTGRQMHRAFVDSGLSSCLDAMSRAEFVPEGTPDCGADRFVDQYGVLGTLAYVFAVLPLLVGMFFGAPLVARELEHGTHRLVWTQGATRLRWAAAKLGLVGMVALALAAAYAQLVSWWLTPLLRASASRFDYLTFDVVGVVPIGYTAFAVAAGVAAGTVWRRMLPAMAATLVAFLATRVVVTVARPHFLPVQERRFPVVTDTRPNPLLGDWLLDYGLYAPDGHKLRRVYRASCAPAGPEPCPYLPGSYNLHTYQPADRFWLFQYIEAGIFIALAVALLAIASYRIGRRIA